MASRLHQLRDELRAAGSRWTAGPSWIADLDPTARRRWLADVPRAGAPGLARRAAVARQARAHRAEPPDAGLAACDLRARSGVDFVGPASDLRARTAEAVALFSVLQTTLRVALDAPALALADAVLEDLEAGSGAGGLERAGYVLRLAQADAEATAPRVLGWRELRTAAEMTGWIATRGALLAVLAVHADFFSYASGVYHHVSGALEGGHTVSVIGFDGGGEYWIAQNGWGASWGEGGCFRIAFGEGGIDASMWGAELQWDSRPAGGVKE